MTGSHLPIPHDPTEVGIAAMVDAHVAGSPVVAAVPPHDFRGDVVRRYIACHSRIVSLPADGTDAQVPHLVLDDDFRRYAAFLEEYWPVVHRRSLHHRGRAT